MGRYGTILYPLLSGTETEMSLEDELRSLTPMMVAMLEEMIGCHGSSKREILVDTPEEKAAAQALFDRELAAIAKEGDRLVVRATRSGRILMGAYRYMTKKNPTKWAKVTKV
jgi:hypothetical protein